jgi:hypothetical protein
MIASYMIRIDALGKFSSTSLSGDIDGVNIAR